jgi:peptidoglycan hydrolase-like protein with peptidoglycan-binding domain
MNRTRNTGLAVAAAVALLAPLIAGTALVIRAASQSPLESAADTAPLIGAVERAERFREAQVAIAVETADAFAPTTQASGVVTTLGIVPGSEVATGAVVVTVNDANVTAYVSDSPLFRDISRGLVGRDVATAQAVLKNLGYYSGPVDGKAGLGTERAIVAFNKANGYGDKNTVLWLAALTWVGPAPVTVAEPKVVVGGTVSPGDELFTTTTSLAAIKVTETPNVPRDAEVEIVVGDVTAPYDPGSGGVTEPDAVAAIAASLGTATEGVATVRLVTPQEVGTVPASAVVSDPTGATCLFPDVLGVPVIITPLGGTLGTVDLDIALAGQQVLLNPRDVRASLSCTLSDSAD